MKRLQIPVISLFFCILLASCGNKQPQIPAGIMDTAVFADFLTEAQLIESYQYIVVLRTHDSLAYQVPAAYDSLYHKFGITSEDYDSTLAWYVAHPLLLQDVYERVSQRLKHLCDQEAKLPPDPEDTVEEHRPGLSRHHPIRVPTPKVL